MKKQQAVWWPLKSAESSANDYDRFGQPQSADPVQLTELVRWEDVTEEFIAADGTTQLSRAKVFVGRDMQPGDVIMLGVIADITNSTHPKENVGAWEIRRFEKLPNIKATEFLRTAIL
jgi:hypothetical protein